MGKAEKTALFLAGLAGLFWVLSKRTLAIPGFAMSRTAVLALARKTVVDNFSDVDFEMAAAIAIVESDGNPLALRYEPGLGDASIGLMQTLLGTARWLAADMGYERYGVPGLADLLDADKSMYFGAAYLQWLRHWNGVRRSDEWIVMAYNAGPGNVGTGAAEAYLAKYRIARAGGDPHASPPPEPGTGGAALSDDPFFSGDDFVGGA